MSWHLLSRLSGIFLPVKDDPTRLLLTSRKDLHEYRIGEWSYGPLRVVRGSVSASLSIGKFCSFAADTSVFLGGEHDTMHVTTYPLSYFLGGKDRYAHSRSKGNVAIGNDVWVGRGATILSGVSIADGAVIGAESLVASDVPAYSIVAGNPARLVKKRFSEETISELLRIAWWDWPEAKIRAEMTRLQSRGIEEFVARHRV
jgi:acetyltransferase-like isoleucine patch superfamily enzyme